jgi:hypothetical protein
MRIPSADQLARHCRSGRYRRCDVFRSFLGSLAAEPARWRETSHDAPADGAAVALPRTDSKGDRS